MQKCAVCRNLVNLLGRVSCVLCFPDVQSRRQNLCTTDRVPDLRIATPRTCQAELGVPSARDSRDPPVPKQTWACVKYDSPSKIAVFLLVSLSTNPKNDTQKQTLKFSAKRNSWKTDLVQQKKLCQVFVLFQRATIEHPPVLG